MGKTDRHVFCIWHLPKAISQPRLRYESPKSISDNVTGKRSPHPVLFLCGFLGCVILRRQVGGTIMVSEAIVRAHFLKLLQSFAFFGLELKNLS